MANSDYSIIPLRKLIKNDEGSVQHILDSYNDCVGSDQEQFLRDDAVMMEKKNMCRTYLAIDTEYELIGYFSIGLRCMKVPKRMTESGKEKDDRFRLKMNVDPESRVAQSYLIGQLSRSKNSPKGIGSMLLRDALRLISRANQIVGCRVVRVDCTDDLLKYYTEHGFRMIRRNDADDLNQMAYIIRKE